jgi:hypothetical protein
MHAGNSGLLGGVRHKPGDLAVRYDIEAEGPFPARENAVMPGGAWRRGYRDATLGVFVCRDGTQWNPVVLT